MCISNILSKNSIIVRKSPYQMLCVGLVVQCYQLVHMVAICYAVCLCRLQAHVVSKPAFCSNKFWKVPSSEVWRTLQELGMLYHRPACDNQSLSVIMFSVSGYVFGLCVMTVPKAASPQGGEPRVPCDKLNAFLTIPHFKYHMCCMPSLQLAYEICLKTEITKFLHWI